MKLFIAKTFFKHNDLEFNYNKVIEIYDNAVEKDCNILVFGELALSGYLAGIPSKKLVAEQDFFLEELANYTKGKKTRIVIGCFQYIEGYTDDDGIVRPEKLYNSVVVVANGYIQSVSNMTSIAKTNIFNSYRFFDKDVALRELKYEADTYNVLLGDDILESKNILFLKERDAEFTFCLDTAKIIPEKQLEKIAKWTKKGLIYVNAFTYNATSFNGEILIYNGIGDILYKHNAITEEILEVEITYKSGQCELFIKKAIGEDDNFVNVLAKNERNKTIIYEIDKETKEKFEENVVLISFKKEMKGVKFIDLKKYFNFNVEKTREIKEMVVKSLYEKKEYIFI